MENFPISKFQTIETPFYYYDTELLKKTLEEATSYARTDIRHLHYAIKANANPRILSIIRSYGLGADCVSAGEIKAALDAGFPASDIFYAGVGKTDKEIEFALDTNIRCFNVESVPELENINAISAAKSCIARVAVRINPDIDAHTHHYITTGLTGNKFGIPFEELENFVTVAKKLKNIELIGIHFHIGSEILDTEPFVALCDRIREVLDKFADWGIDISIVNVGGGLGIDYDDPNTNPIPDFRNYFDTFAANLQLCPDQELHFEPGRSIVGQCGSLITRVLYVKETRTKKFAIVDAGMNDLIRPALYEAHHHIENLTSKSPVDDAYDIVGPVCESADCFAQDKRLPLTARGDLLAIRSAGAYGEVMASTYNCRRLASAVFSDDLMKNV